jgi:PAS domain S-box-containing protein
MKKMKTARKVSDRLRGQETESTGSGIRSMASTNQELLSEIAELQRRLQEAEKEKQRLASFREMNPNPVLEIDLAGAVTFANPAAMEVIKNLAPPRGLLAFLPTDWWAILAVAQVQGEKIFYREIRLQERMFAESILFIEPYQVWRIYAVDITERYCAEEAMRHAHNRIINEKNRLEAVLAVLPAGVAILDDLGGITQTNAAYEELWGGPRPLVRDASGYAAFKAWWLDTGQPVRPEEWACSQVLLQGETVIGQMLEIENFNGERRCIINSGAPIRDAAGRITGCAVALVDITELYRAEEALHHSEEQARQQLAEIETIYDSAPVGLCALDDQGRYVRINDRLAQMNGAPAQDHIGRTIPEMIPDLADFVEPLVNKVLKSGQPLRNVEFVGTTADAPEIKRYGLVQGLPIKDSQGKVVGVNVSVDDITQRKQAEKALRESEQRFRDMFIKAADAIIMADAETKKFFMVNDMASRMLGYTRDELSQLGVADIHPPEALAYVQEQFELQAAQKIYLASDLPMRRSDGSVWYADVSSFPTIMQGKTYLMGTFRDVTQRKQAEEILRRSHEELEQLVVARTTDLSQTVNELHNEILQRRQAEQALKESEERLRLLAGQLINAQEQERKRLAAELHDQLGHSLLIMKLSLGSIMRTLPPGEDGFRQLIQEQLEYLDDLIEQARRLYYNLSPGELEDLGLNTALEGLLEEFWHNQPDITYEVKLPALAGLFGLPGQITIYRLLQEALSNIGKHAGATEINVWGRLDNQLFRLCIEDDGQGFDVSEVERNLKKSIGLAAMKERLNLVNGSLEINSQKGQGTRLTFIIPCAPAA